MDYATDQTDVSETEPRISVPFPTVGEFLHPRFFLGFLRGFVISWFRSRHYRDFFLGSPTLLFTVIGAVAVWQLSKPPGLTLANAYERAAVNADRIESYTTSDLLWERLMQLRPDDKSYRLQLVKSLTEREEFTEALRHLDILTGEQGYAPARLWLVKQSRLDPSAFRLPEEQQIKQLQAVVEDQPRNGEARRLLVQCYIERGEYDLAEFHLLQAAEDHPALGLPLYEVQLRLKREDLSTGLRHLRTAAGQFKRTVVQSPEDAEARISWAQALVHLGEKENAEEVLTEGIRLYDSPELRSAATEFYLRETQLLVTRSTLNAGRAAEFLVKAARLQPGHPLLPPLCVTLAGMGVRFSEDDLVAVMAHLRTNLEANASDIITRLTLAQLLATLGRYTEAIELLETDQTDDTRIQSLLVRIYDAAGRRSEATALTDDMLAALQQNAHELPDEPAPVTELAGGLIIAKRFSEAVTVVEAFASRTSQEVRDLPQEIRRHYVTASVAAFMEFGSNAPNAESLSVLRNAVEAEFVSLQLIQLIATLAYSKGPLEQQADHMLAEILAKGEANVSVYSALGTVALSSGNLDAAVRNLRLALVLAPQNPQVQNNLALALIRQSETNASEALELCNQALDTIPKHPDVLSTRAEIHIAGKKWLEAQGDLEIALRRRQNSELVRTLLIKVCTAQGQSRLADKHREALERIQHQKLMRTEPERTDN